MNTTNSPLKNAKISAPKFRWNALQGLLSAVILPLAALAGEVTVTNPNPPPIVLDQVLSREKMFTQADDVKIQGKIFMGVDEMEQNKTYYKCNSLTIGDGNSAFVWIKNADLLVAKGMKIGGGKSGGFQLQGNSSLHWGETLDVASNGVLSLVCGPQEIKGGSLVLSGQLELKFYSPESIDQFSGDGIPLITVAGRLETGSGALVDIKLTGSAADALLPAGEFPLIACKEFSGDLPQVKITEGNPNQKLSLKKTSKGLALVVK